MDIYIMQLFIDLANFHTWKLDDTMKACLANRLLTHNANGSTSGHTSA